MPPSWVPLLCESLRPPRLCVILSPSSFCFLLSDRCYLLSAFSSQLVFSLSTSSTLPIQFLFAPKHRNHLRSVRRVDGQKAKKNRHRARPSRPRQRQTPPHLSSRSL